MEDIKLIYCNYFGTSFFLKRCTINQVNKVQLVFNKSAFDFSNEELTDLKVCIKSSLVTLNNIEENDKLSIVLRIKYNKEMHLSFEELKALKDLVNGTLFYLNFENIIDDLIGV